MGVVGCASFGHIFLIVSSTHFFFASAGFSLYTAAIRCYIIRKYTVYIVVDLAFSGLNGLHCRHVKECWIHTLTEAYIGKYLQFSSTNCYCCPLHSPNALPYAAVSVNICS